MEDGNQPQRPKCYQQQQEQHLGIKFDQSGEAEEATALQQRCSSIAARCSSRRAAGAGESAAHLNFNGNIRWKAGAEAGRTAKVTGARIHYSSESVNDVRYKFSILL